MKRLGGKGHCFLLVRVEDLRGATDFLGKGCVPHHREGKDLGGGISREIRKL